MNGIPVLTTEADGIARAWEDSLVKLYHSGCRISTQYDKVGDAPSRDATMLITVHHPLSEPMIHRDFPGGPEDLQEYVMEVCEGIKDHLVRNPNDPHDTRWEYTYHQRLFAYDGPGIDRIDQIGEVVRKLAESPHTRRAQAITWKVWEDNSCYDPPCLQSVWCRLLDQGAGQTLSMNVRFRSNDAYKAAFMNIFALVQLQKSIANALASAIDEPVAVGRYCHMADSYHIYGANLAEFEGRLLGAIEKRPFEKRTLRYEEWREVMEAARPAIVEKAKNIGRE